VAFVNQEHADASGAIAVSVRQDSTANGIFIDQNGNGTALNIDSIATSQPAINVAMLAAQYGLAIDNAHASTPYGIFVDYSAASPNGTANFFMYGLDSAATRVELRSNGGIANFQSNDADLSDGRLKTAFTSVKDYLPAIMGIDIGTFCYLDQSDDVPNLGADANQVYEVAPELTTLVGEEWGPGGMDDLRGIFSKDLAYAHMAAFQQYVRQTDSKIESLEAEIEQLRN
jgi:hypothetical protein